MYKLFFHSASTLIPGAPWSNPITVEMGESGSSVTPKFTGMTIDKISVNVDDILPVYTNQKQLYAYIQIDILNQKGRNYKSPLLPTLFTEEVRFQFPVPTFDDDTAGKQKYYDYLNGSAEGNRYDFISNDRITAVRVSLVDPSTGKPLDTLEPWYVALTLYE